MFQNLLNGNSIIQYRKIPLIRPGQMTNLMGFYSVICNLLDLLFFFFFLQYKARILAYFTSCKMWNMLKVNNKDTRIHKVNDKVNNKDIVDVVLVSLLLDLNTFHFLLQCFYCWLISVNCRLGLLLVVLTLRAWWINLGKVSIYGETR